MLLQLCPPHADPLVELAHRIEALEARLGMRIGGGWTMLAALWRMALVNRRPGLKVGEAVPSSMALVDTASPTAPVSLASLCRPGVPLVLNFGSCT